jgi:hypothetical protein
MLLASFTAQAWAASPPADRYLSYSGIATGRHSTEFLYAEHHVLLYRDGRLAERVVLYTCRDGSAFARKTVNYVGPLAPDFTLDDAATGMREGVRSQGDERQVFFRGNRLAPEAAGPLPQIRGLVIDTGFDAFIRANWQALMTGKPLDLHFLVPSRLEEMRFQVQRLRSGSLDGVPVDVFRLKLAGVLGWVLPGIDVSYSVDDHTLMRYEGLSDLRDAAGDNFQTAITFRSGDVKPADEQLNSSARQAPLAACK